MKFILATLFYWPAWLVFALNGYHFTGMMVGTAVVAILVLALHRVEFGTWKFWE